MVGGRGENRMNMKTHVVTLFITQCLQPVKKNAEKQKWNFCIFFMALYFSLARMLSVLSSQQIGIRGALQDCAR